MSVVVPERASPWGGALCVVKISFQVETPPSSRLERCVKSQVRISDLFARRRRQARSSRRIEETPSTNARILAVAWINCRFHSTGNDIRRRRRTWEWRLLSPTCLGPSRAFSLGSLVMTGARYKLLNRLKKKQRLSPPWRDFAAFSDRENRLSLSRYYLFMQTARRARARAVVKRVITYRGDNKCLALRNSSPEYF